KKYFQGAAQHLTEKFPMQCGGEKNASTCHTKWTNLREEFYAVIELKALSGFS
ncbi:hypothetical protein SCLCIDRAFT_138065, partial [Scleroderma citrinum Foug A]